MLLETYEPAWDFELLDSGEGWRLEKWGQALLCRPDPQAIWQKSLPETEWQKAWAIFRTGKDEEKGKWEIKKPLPTNWQINFEGTKLQLKPTPFKHTGVFAEQSAQWHWMLKKIKNRKPASAPKILNLFAYTGAASVVLANAGAKVTHVDASKPAVTWANENKNLNNLNEDSIRWIVDDAAKFVKRELKRGTRYDGILLDPPAFGHSPDGKTWKFGRDIPGLLRDCTSLLSDQPCFLLMNAYATNASALAVKNLLEDATGNLKGSLEFGELCLKQKNGRLLSTGIFSRWFPL